MATMRGPGLTVTHLPVRVDDAVGLFRGEGVIGVLLALTHVVLESKAIEGTERRGERTNVAASGKFIGAGSAFLLPDWRYNWHFR